MNNTKNYNLFLGLNDKDSKKQEFTTIDAYKICSKLATKKFDGCTITQAQGYYRDSNNNLVLENTLQIQIATNDKKAILQYCKLLKTIFNQECILIYEAQYNTIFY